MKYINASLERMHTFGMASVHKSKHEVEKIDSQYESIFEQQRPAEGADGDRPTTNQDGKRITKTESLTKLKAPEDKATASTGKKKLLFSSHSKQGT